MRRNYLLYTSVGLFLLSLLLSVALFLSHNKAPRESANQYPYLAKRLFVENPNDIIINFEPLRTDVRKYLETSGLVHSYYFEYLPTGSSIRVGESNELVGASLMKIPIVMDLYKAAELGKINLDKEVTVPNNAINGDQQFGNTSNLKPGSKITLRTAARQALIESDNTAAYIVYSSTKDLLTKGEVSISNLDVPIQEKTTNDGGVYVLVGARAYSSFLKCLYFSCHLNYDNSQQMLSYLADSPGDGRIASGVPAGTKVAHKIGSFSKTTQSDCGIVYQENRNYLICLMLQTDQQTAQKHFQAISKMTYDYVGAVN